MGVWPLPVFQYFAAILSVSIQLPRLSASSRPLPFTLLAVVGAIAQVPEAPEEAVFVSAVVLPQGIVPSHEKSPQLSLQKLRAAIIFAPVSIFTVTWALYSIAVQVVRL